MKNAVRHEEEKHETHKGELTVFTGYDENDELCGVEVVGPSPTISNKSYILMTKLASGWHLNWSTSLQEIKHGIEWIQIAHHAHDLAFQEIE